VTSEDVDSLKGSTHYILVALAGTFILMIVVFTGGVFKTRNQTLSIACLGTDAIFSRLAYEVDGWCNTWQNLRSIGLSSLAPSKNRARSSLLR